MSQAATDLADAEQGVGFDALQAQADELDAAAGVGTLAPAAPPANTAAELLAALTMARLMVQPLMAWWPDFGQVWGDATLRGIADAGAQVMDRHGWTMGEVMSQWGPYIALIGATAPPTLVTWQAIKARRDAPPQEAAACPS